MHIGLRLSRKRCNAAALENAAKLQDEPATSEAERAPGFAVLPDVAFLGEASAIFSVAKRRTARKERAESRSRRETKTVIHEWDTIKQRLQTFTLTVG